MNGVPPEEGVAGFPRPEVDPVNRRFWAGAKEERLLIQACTECEAVVYPARVACPGCFGELEWMPADGRGWVYSFGIVHRPNLPSVFGERTPFVTAVVELVEGCRMVTNLVNCDVEVVEIGMPVRVTFEKPAAGLVLPQFEPADDLAGRR